MAISYFCSAHHTTYNMSVESHLHAFFEFNLVLSDNVKIETEDGVYNASYGDMFLFEPFLFHKISAENMDYERCIIDIYEEELFSAADCLREVFNDVKKSRIISFAGHEKELKEVVALFDKAIPFYDKFWATRDFEIASCVGEIIRILSLLPRTDIKSSQPQNKVAQVLKYVKQHACSNITINDICEKFSMSPSSLHKMFKTHTGMSPGEYILRIKFNVAVDCLKKGKSVTETANIAGFNSYSHFIRIFKSRVGVPPHKYTELRKDKRLIY